MLADLTCDPRTAFDSICRAIGPHDPTGLAGPIVERLIGPIALLVLVYFAGRLIRRFVDAGMRRSGTDVQVRTLVHNVITAVTYVIAVMCAIVAAGVDIALLVTVAGLGTVAIGLALQDVLRNILAGMWLLLEHPFRLGDNITVLDQSGIVQDITLRTTTLRTGDGRLAVLPNLTAFSNPIVNASTYTLRQFTVTVREPIGTDIERALRDARAILAAVPEIAGKPSPSVLPQVDGRAVLLHCRYWVDQTAHDPDAVAATVTQRLWAVRAASAN